jgi:thiamine-phosphate pyrophosphorylase
MDNINFNTYIITSDDLPLLEQLNYLKKLNNYKYKSEIAIQIRFNNQSNQNIIDFIKELKKELYDIRLIVNNSINVMENLELDGVHLKEKENLNNIDIKRYQKEGKLILKSTHSLKSIKEAEEFGLNAITYGPVFYTPSKKIYGEPNGYELIKNNEFRIPIFALGGINMNNIKELKHYFYGIAAIRLFINENIIENLYKRRNLWK